MLDTTEKYLSKSPSIEIDFSKNDIVTTSEAQIANYLAASWKTFSKVENIKP